MFDDTQFYRQRETDDRLLADTADLIKVREKALRSAERWRLLAEKAENTQRLAALRAADQELK